MPPTIRDFRHAIQAAFAAYAASDGGIRSHMTAAYVSYMLRGQPGLSGEEQVQRFTLVHTAFQHLLNDDPQNALLYELHTLIHGAYQLVLEENGIEVEDEEDEIDPLVSHADDFAKWAEGLADPSAIEDELAAEAELEDDEED